MRLLGKVSSLLSSVLKSSVCGAASLDPLTMKYIVLTLLLPLLISLPTATAAPQRIAVKGNRFVTPDGNTVIFKGLSAVRGVLESR